MKKAESFTKMTIGCFSTGILIAFGIEMLIYLAGSLSEMKWGDFLGWHVFRVDLIAGLIIGAVIWVYGIILSVFD